MYNDEPSSNVVSRPITAEEYKLIIDKIDAQIVKSVLDRRRIEKLQRSLTSGCEFVEHSMVEELANLSVVSFNQDGRSLAVGHQRGYMVYSMDKVFDVQNLEPECYSESRPTELHDAIIFERLFNSSFVIVVGRRSPRVMYVYHLQSKNMICDYKYANSVLNVKLNRKRVIVCLEDALFVYNLENMKTMHSISDTPLNKTGLLDLSPNEESCLLAYPGSLSSGTVHVFDAKTFTSVITFQAHNSSLAAMRFNVEGTMLATASNKGTVIRVFGMPNGDKLFEFRRGLSRCANIFSMAFSADSAFLCTSSNTETIHVFKLEKREDPAPADSQAGTSWYDYLHGIASTASTYLPAQVCTVLGSIGAQMNDLTMLMRSFASAHLPSPGLRNAIAMPTIGGASYVLVATSEGYLFCYRVEPEGGQCHLIKQHRIGPLPIQEKKKSRSPVDTIVSTNNDSNNDLSPPNHDDVSEFPPMSHMSG